MTGESETVRQAGRLRLGLAEAEGGQRLEWVVRASERASLSPEVRDVTYIRMSVRVSVHGGGVVTLQAFCSVFLRRYFFLLEAVVQGWGGLVFSARVRLGKAWWRRVCGEGGRWLVAELGR